MRVPKKRVLVASLLIVAVLALGLAATALAQLPPAVNRGEVYVDGQIAGAGLVVEAFVGNETTARAQETTDANGVVILQVQYTGGDLTDPATALSFTVDGVAATETPDVDATLAYQAVRLDVVSFDPWDYDTDQDNVISKTEALGAVNDYFDSAITKDEALEVVILYFS